MLIHEILQNIEERDKDVLTPVLTYGDLRIKHDDLFEVFGSRGGKARSCYAICKKGIEEGFKGFSTAGSKQSPQIQIASFMAKEFGVPLHAHTPSGDYGYEIEIALKNGCELFQHRPGYNNVIIARSREDAKENGFLEIPFGMECWEAVFQTATQVKSLVNLEGIKRIVMPVGSGMSLSGVLWGLTYYGLTDIEILGIVVGADPSKRLEKYAPLGWDYMVEFKEANYDYHDYAPNLLKIGEDEVIIDPIYEAKCLDFMDFGKDEILWSVGIRDGVCRENSKEFVVG